MSIRNAWIFIVITSVRYKSLQGFLGFIKRDRPLPSWSHSDVQAFIASDPVHGPALKTAREAANFAVTGSIIGAVSTSWICVEIFKEFTWFDTLAAQTKFLKWWEDKSEQRS